jgi:hypothetical protein
MINRMCDAGGICGHTPQCDHFCHFTDAGLEPEVVRKVKPYPAIPDDIEPMSDQWHKIGAWMLWCIFAVLLVICTALFFTGIWIWSLLI